MLGFCLPVLARFNDIYPELVSNGIDYGLSCTKLPLASNVNHNSQLLGLLTRKLEFPQLFPKVS